MFVLYSFIFVILISSHYLGFLDIPKEIRIFLDFLFVLFFFFSKFSSKNRKSDDIDDISFDNPVNPKGSPPDFDSVQFMKDLNESIERKKKLEKIER